MKKTHLLIFLAVSTLLVSCFKDNDDTEQFASTAEISNFIYRGLNFFYLYKGDTQELADDAFANDSELAAFVNSYSTPEEFFDFLTPSRDRFSRLFPDFNVIEDALAGTSMSNGMEFALVRYPDGSGNVFGFVRYVLPNTDASSKGLTRGTIFNTVGGIQITEENFSDLFSFETYTIGFATYDGTTVTPINESLELTKAPYTENPVFRTNTIETNGRKIGYLMYNGFTNEFDSQLNAAFGDFAAAGITDLVLDLRYNGGGSVRTATYLSSMITGQFTNQTFYQEFWNDDRQAEFAEDGVFVNSFVNGGESINSLNLTQVYILSTGSTASASELVINGLTPYIDVVQVGTNTVGKYQASFLMYDSPTFAKSVNINPNHTYVMLPLVFQTANADGFTDFDEGLIPDINLEEDYSNLGALGNENEPLLAAAIADITGIPAPFAPPTRAFPLEILGESKSESPMFQKMIVEKK